MPAATQDRVSRMVEWEADQSLLVPTRYLRDRTGRVLSKGDSGAEEDSWYALAPALGVAMFPQHPHRTAWLVKQEQLQVASWARPSATASPSTVAGRPLSSWLAGKNYPVPAYRAPGGTIYSRSTATVYYPQGCDWGLGQELPYALADAQAQLFAFDSTGTAAGHLARHASAELAMQARTADGATYVDAVQYTYVGREEHTAQLAGQLYLS